MLPRKIIIYTVFGLNIDSEVLLPELVTVDGSNAPDVHIVYGDTPGELVGAHVRHDRRQVAPDRFLLNVAGVGRYFVQNGNYVVVEPDSSAEESEVRLFLLGSVMGALLLQRGITPIHGSAVVMNERAVIIAGCSGVGKSTLLGALLNCGATYLTDDLAAVTIDKAGAPWVQSGYPQQKLWRDSAMKMGIDVSTCVRVQPDEEKYFVPTKVGFCLEPKRLVALCELRAEECREAIMTQLAGPDKLSVMLRNTFRKRLVAGMGLQPAHFRKSTAVVEQIYVSNLVRPIGTFLVEEQVILVQQMMKWLIGS